ncbi:hypothetical protein N7G274_006246 [Stereocaulon virgatum]|uniref:Uncharacterized protein n=1 Tax=Stereocaulon virgatum TaxID=373712 RepID=A0ABR4A6V4_9LECA
MLESAKLLRHEVKVLHDLKGICTLDREGHIFDLAALAQGNVDSVIRPKQFRSMKAVAKAMTTKTAVDSEADIDLEEMMKWLRRSDEGKAAKLDDYDALRDALVKRVRALKAMLPSDLPGAC